MLFLFGCDNLNTGESVDKTEGQTGSAYDVYIAGSSANNIPCYWKNGVGTPLSSSAVAVNVTDMAVSGTDVYVVGGEYDGEMWFPVYWKNGTKVALNGGSDGWAEAIAVDGTDVHIVANCYTKDTSNTYQVVYWKNGTKTVLDTGESRAWDVGVSGNTVYISGYVNNVPCYWKNGQHIGLSGPSDADSTYTSKLAIANGHFYIEGFSWYGSDKKFFYWIDGTTRKELTMPVNPEWIFQSGIAVTSNGDVYMTGHYRYNGQPGKSCYWKNGTITDLVGGREYTQVNAIAAVDNDIYMVGSLDNGDGNFEAGYWINGIKTAFPGGTGFGSAIFVVAKK
jgi:hypothetical protein